MAIRVRMISVKTLALLLPSNDFLKSVNHTEPKLSKSLYTYKICISRVVSWSVDLGKIPVLIKVNKSQTLVNCSYFEFRPSDRLESWTHSSGVFVKLLDQISRHSEVGKVSVQQLIFKCAIILKMKSHGYVYYFLTFQNISMVCLQTCFTHIQI
jgi:hypothetical protein